MVATQTEPSAATDARCSPRERAAGMATIAAAYGYIVPGDEPSAWGADSVVADVDELTHLVLKAVNLDD